MSKGHYDPDQPRDEYGRWTDEPGGVLHTGEALRDFLTNFAKTDEGLAVARYVYDLHEEQRWGKKPQVARPDSNPIVHFLHGGSSNRFVARVWRNGQSGFVLKSTMHDQDIDNEEWAGHLANAMGLPFDAYRVEQQLAGMVVMPFIEGPMGYDLPMIRSRFSSGARKLDFMQDRIAQHDEYMQNTPGSFEIAVLDLITRNADRNHGNFVHHPSGGFVPIDHAFTDVRTRTDQWEPPILIDQLFAATAHNPFVAHWFASEYDDGLSFDNVDIDRLEALFFRVRDELVDVPTDIYAEIIHRFSALLEIARWRKGLG